MPLICYRRKCLLWMTSIWFSRIKRHNLKCYISLIYHRRECLLGMTSFWFSGTKRANLKCYISLFYYRQKSLLGMTSIWCSGLAWQWMNEWKFLYGTLKTKFHTKWCMLKAPDAHGCSRERNQMNKLIEGKKLHKSYTHRRSPGKSRKFWQPTACCTSFCFFKHQIPSWNRNTGHGRSTRRSPVP